MCAEYFQVYKTLSHLTIRAASQASISSTFTNEKTEAQRENVARPGSQDH